jgi:hypothetical protein
MPSICVIFAHSLSFFSRSPWIIRQLLAWSFVTGIAMPVDGDTQA